MDFSDEESSSNGELVDDILGPEDLFNDEADEEAAKDQLDNTSDKNDIQKEDSKEKDQRKIKQPRIVKNPRVTLTVDALSGKNGLSALKKLFSNFKFRGNGHEEEDLTKILGILQQWMCFRLCPSYDFESCMLQLEALGKKKAVQTLMKKYRLGIDDWGESKLDAEEYSKIDEVVEEEGHIPRTDFDILESEEILNVESDAQFSQDNIVQKQNTHSEEEFTLTQEQLERIARNKKLAEERRRKKMSTLVEVNKLPEESGNQDLSAEKISEKDSG